MNMLIGLIVGDGVKDLISCDSEISRFYKNNNDNSISYYSS
jgi:hypothetical protein